MSIYNKLSYFQYASFQILPVHFHFVLFLSDSWYPDHDNVLIILILSVFQRKINKIYDNHTGFSEIVGYV